VSLLEGNLPVVSFFFMFLVKESNFALSLNSLARMSEEGSRRRNDFGDRKTSSCFS